MEENVSNTTQINSVPDEEVLQRSITCMDRKRKLQAEELGLPPTKHKWLSRDFVWEHQYSSDAQSDEAAVEMCDSGEESAKDSNSIAADADSTISVSNDTDVGGDQVCFKECSSYQRFTSSIDWVGNSSKSAINPLEPRSAMKSIPTALESSSIGKEHEFPHHNIKLQSSMNFEENFEVGGHIDCSCPECRTSYEDYTDKELEEIFYSNRVSPNNYVLSSGRWTLKPDAQQGTKKLTIDKEFEQYFSTLML